MQAVIGALRAILGLDTTAFEKGIGKAQKDLSALSRDFKRTAADLEKMGKAMSAAITAPLAIMGTLTLRAAANFEEGMNKVQAATGATADQMKLLSDQAKLIGRTTAFSATEAAGAMEALAKNGLDVTAILAGAADATVKLAAANGAQLEPAANIVTDTMNNFKKTAADLPGVIDQVTGTLIASKFNFDDYKLAIGQAAGVAGKVGITFEDFNAGLAATSSAFASGSDAGTSFKTFLTKLAPASKEAADVMKLLKLEFFDAKGAMLPLEEIAGRLQKALGGLSDKSRTEAATKMFGTDAMRTALSLMSEGTEGIKKMRAEIAKASASDQAAVRLQGFNGALRQLRAALEGLQIAIGESGLLRWATQLVERLTALTLQLGKLNPELLRLGTIAAGVAAAVGPLLLVAGGLVGGIGKAGVALGRAAPMFAPLLAAVLPITKAALAVAALTVAVVGFGDQIPIASNGAITLADALTVITTNAERLAGRIAALGRSFTDWIGKSETLAGVLAFVTKNTEGLGDALSVDNIVRAHIKVIDSIANLLRGVGNVIVASWKNLKPVILEVFQDIGVAIGEEIYSWGNYAIDAGNWLRRQFGREEIPRLNMQKFENENRGAVEAAGKALAEAWNAGFANNFLSEATQKLAAEALDAAMRRLVPAPTDFPITPGDFNKKKPPPAGGGTGGRNLNIPTDSGKSLENALQRIAEETKALEAAKKFLETSGIASERLLFQAAEELERIGKKTAEMLKGLDPDSEAANRIRAVVTALEKMRTATNNVEAAIKTAFDVERQWGNGQAAHLETLRLLNEARATGRLSVEALTAAVKEANEALQDQDIKARGAVEGWTGFTAGMEAAAVEMQRANSSFNQGKRVFGELQSATREISAAFFELDADIGQVLANVAKRIAQLAFDMLVLQPIFDSVAKSIKAASTGGSGSGGGGGSGWIGSIISGIGSIFGGGGGDGVGPGTGFTYASGGNTPTNAPYWVGEHGKELRFDANPGTIIPHDQSKRIAAWYENAANGSAMMDTRAAVSDQDVTSSVDASRTENHFNISTGVAQTVRAELMTMMPRITKAAADRVLYERRRGGDMKKAFATR